MDGWWRDDIVVLLVMRMLVSCGFVNASELLKRIIGLRSSA